MTRLALCLAGLLLLLAALAPSAAGQPFRLVDTETVRVCPGDGSGQVPDFAAPDCVTTGLWDIDAQGRELWVRATLALSEADLASPGPYGLMVAAKAASEIRVNGVPVGANGRPAARAAEERPGRMDSLFYLPREHLRPGENTIVLHMSAHHGVMALAAPMHHIVFGPYRHPHQDMIAAYWPSMITFGVFLLGLVFFAVSAVRGEDREGSALLALASGFAGLQLLAEVIRALWAYPYPVHELRLIAIAACAFGFGVCLVAYLFLRVSALSRRARLVRTGAVALAMLAVVLTTPGFDGKTGYALLTAGLAGLGWCALWALQRRPGAIGYGLVMAVFCGLILVFRHVFIDLVFYWAAAGVLLWLFWRQALVLARARRERRSVERRADRLETALARARQASAPARLQLVSSGRVDYVDTAAIVQLKGAGDYVEVHFEDGRTALYNGSLAALEAELPETFLRVHRSHIVNTAFVGALEREGSGVGRLVLATGSEVPVSRRILPKVRSALGAKSA